MRVKHFWLSLALVLFSVVSVQADDGSGQTESSDELAVGQPMPEFESVDSHGRPWRSVDHVGRKILVLYFYHGDFKCGCTKQAIAYRDEMAKIEELGAEVVGISGDTPATH